MAKVTAADGHVYDKSSSANATTAPTNQATIDKAQGKNVDPKVLDFVTVIDYEWNLNGNISPVGIQKEYGYTKAEYTKLCNDPVAIAFLNERGIQPKFYYEPTGDYKLPVSHSKLTPVQLLAANSMLDLTDNKTNKKKLQDLGVTTKQYNAWMRDPEFRGYIQQRAENLLGDNQHEALLALLDKVNSGDTKAIELYLEMTGRYTRASATAQSGPDLQNIIVRIVEIIIDEVDDPQTAFRISERLKGLVAGASVAGLLPETQPIVQPEIAVPREQTDEVKELMSKGVGYDG